MSKNISVFGSVVRSVCPHSDAVHTQEEYQSNWD
jgi:hypothetical protein